MCVYVRVGGSTYLSRYTPVISAALPEPTTEAFNEAHFLLLVRKVHFPYERAVAENPHVLTSSRETATEGEDSRRETNGLSAGLYLGGHSVVNTRS